MTTNDRSFVSATLMPLGKTVAGATLVIGALVSIYVSLDTHSYEVIVHPKNICNSEGFGYQQSGSPYPVALPNINGDHLMRDDGSTCISIGEWPGTHLNYWNLLLNAFYWTGFVYVAALVPYHGVKWFISRP